MKESFRVDRSTMAGKIRQCIVEAHDSIHEFEEALVISRKENNKTQIQATPYFTAMQGVPLMSWHLLLADQVVEND